MAFHTHFILGRKIYILYPYMHILVCMYSMYLPTPLPLLTHTYCHAVLCALLLDRQSD